MTCKIVAASAPGKAVLCGEYAVLDGAPAVGIALDRRAQVRLQVLNGAGSSLTAPGYVDRVLRFRTSPGGHIEWLDPLPQADAHALFTTVWRTLKLELPEEFSVTLDTQAFFDGGRKLGIGSSAALTMALTAALRALDPASGETAFELARAAHRDFQGGRGSGIDVATAAYGGLLKYTLGRASVPLALPAGLCYRVLWSGHSTATAAKIAAHQQRKPDPVDAELADASESVVAALAGGQALPVVDALRAFTAALQVFDRIHRLGIFAAGHRRLADCALRDGNVVYKPCGAGGGDIGIALATDEDVLNEFCAMAEDSGFCALSVRLDPDGVRVELK